jgi:membrane protein YdbS with pleckstrin-like domain
MHCNNCGSYVPAGVRFCANCGVPANDPEATRIARMSSRELEHGGADDDDLERVIFTVRPTLIFIKLGYAAAVIAAILLTVLLAMIPGIEVPFYISLPLALSLLLVPAYYHLKRNMLRYTLTDSKIEIDYGLISRTTRNIPLSKIQDVTISAGILQRMLRFGDVVIDNASEVGGTTILKNINTPRHYADLLLRELRRWQ